MPVGYFLAHPGGLATEPTSQEVIREVALDSMRRAELNPTAPAPQQPERSEDQREQLLSEGCWILQNGTGTIRCPSWHPSNQPTPVYQETEDGFMVGMHDPSATFRSGPERRFRFERQENGDYIYRDPDGRNEIIIHPNGRMEDRTNLPPPNIYILGYPVFGPPPASPAINPASGLIAISITFPWDNPPLPHSMWSEIEESTRGVRRQVAENYDASVTRETLDGLSIELKQIIEKHTEWSLAHQHDFLFRRWDECREDSVGNEARTTIEEFIRQHYRQGGRLEFTEEEIRGFNERRRTESQSFCPYGCLPDMVLQEPQVGDSL
jgi:hypothetical protein